MNRPNNTRLYLAVLVWPVLVNGLMPFIVMISLRSLSAAAYEKSGTSCSAATHELFCVTFQTIVNVGTIECTTSEVHPVSGSDID